MGNKQIIGASCTAFALCSASLYRYVFYRTRSRLSEKLLTPSTHSEDFYSKRREASRKMEDLPQEKVHIRSARGQRLDGYYYPAGDHPGKKVCYMVHGYRGNHTCYAGFYVRY